MDRLERLMTPEEVADVLRVPVTTLYKWRYQGTGPAVMRAGRYLRYCEADVVAWLNDQAMAKGPAA